MKILFCFLHEEYVRNYAGVIAELAERGHTVRLAFPPSKRPREALLADRLTEEYERVSRVISAERPPSDPWTRLATSLRVLADFARFVHPRFANAPLLRDRVASKFENRVREGKLQARSARVAFLAVQALKRVHWAWLSDTLVRFLLFAEQVVPANAEVTEWIRAENPDLVIVTPLVDVGSKQVDYIKSTHALGIRSALGVASWDNLTNKGLMRIVPQRVFVWNDIQRREAVEMHGVPDERVVETGAPRFDEWFELSPSTTREDFCARVGLESGPFAVYTCSSPFIAPDEVTFVSAWVEALRASPERRLSSLGLLIRPHPQNATQWRDVDFSQYDNVAIWPRAGEQPIEEQARHNFFDSLYHSDAVVGVNTSALIEAGIVGKSVFTILAEEFAGTQEGTLHYHYLRHENGGFLHEARELDEHLAHLFGAIEGGPRDQEQTRRFVERFVRPLGLDRPSTPLCADAIEAQLSLSRPEPTQPTWTTRLARAGLESVLHGLQQRQHRSARSSKHDSRRAAAQHRWRRVVTDVATHPATRAAARHLLPLGARRRIKTSLERSSARIDWASAQKGEGRAAQSAKALDRSLRAVACQRGRILAGPWTGDPILEILYWIPFLRQGLEAARIDPARVVASSIHGAEAWYAGICGAFVDDVASLDDVAPAAIEPSRFVELVEASRAGHLPLRAILRRARYVRLKAEPRARWDKPSPEAPVVISGHGALLGELVERLHGRHEIVYVPSLGESLDTDLAVPVLPLKDALLDIIPRSQLVVGACSGPTLVAPFFGVPTLALHDESGEGLTVDLALAARAARDVKTPLVIARQSELDLLGVLAAAAEPSRARAAD